MFNRKSISFIIQAGIIAAVYCVLTFALQPISYGVVQLRISEALTVLPALTPAGIPGLFIGCLLANMLGPFGLIDIILGSAATLIAAICSYLLRKNDWLVPLPPVLVNAVIVGWYLHTLAIQNGEPSSLIVSMLLIGLGQLGSCYIIGLPLLKLLKKRAKSAFDSE